MDRYSIRTGYAEDKSRLALWKKEDYTSLRLRSFEYDFTYLRSGRSTLSSPRHKPLVTFHELISWSE